MTEQEQRYSQEERKLFHQERYFSGTHHYFFELKEAKNGSRYIIISQRKKVGDKFIGTKMRIFEDEMLGFERVLHKFIHAPLTDAPAVGTLPLLDDSEPKHSDLEPKQSESELFPAFFKKLSSTGNWQEFEEYTYYLLKLLGIQAAYNFLGERQAGKADGFFKLGNLAVMYDCTLDVQNLESSKGEQINNYCNRLKQGSIEVSSSMTEEFYNHHKQVWIITRGRTRQIKSVSAIEIKEVAIQDIMSLYEERLRARMSNQSLEMRLQNLGHTS